jgi:hypothetical protein
MSPKAPAPVSESVESMKSTTTAATTTATTITTATEVEEDVVVPVDDGDNEEDGVPKKVQKGQINALAKMLSALRR